MLLTFPGGFLLCFAALSSHLSVGRGERDARSTRKPMERDRESTKNCSFRETS